MRRPRSLVLGSAAAVAVAMLAAGCGGGSGSPGVASVASSTNAAASAQPGLVAYARCMRSNGIPTFPDPHGSGGIPKPQVVAAAERNQNRFDAASTACSHLLPGDSLGPPETAQQIRTRLADELSFARCMRSHGVSNFPDPTAQGHLSVAMVEAHGIDVRSPLILHVVQKCLPASHGALTAAKVKQAIAEAGH